MDQLSAAALALEASLAKQLDGLPTKARLLLLSLVHMSKCACIAPARTLLLAMTVVLARPA